MEEEEEEEEDEEKEQEAKEEEEAHRMAPEEGSSLSTHSTQVRGLSFVK